MNRIISMTLAFAISLLVLNGCSFEDHPQNSPKTDDGLGTPPFLPELDLNSIHSLFQIEDCSLPALSVKTSKPAVPGE